MDCYIKLRIGGHGLDLQEITTELKTIPDAAFKKGDKIISKFESEKTRHTEDSWLVSVKFSKLRPLELEIEEFILSFIPHAKYIKGLSEKFDVTFWIDTYPNTEQFCVNLTKKSIAALYEMGTTFDFGVMYLVAFYDGHYKQLNPNQDMG